MVLDLWGRGLDYLSHLAPYTANPITQLVAYFINLFFSVFFFRLSKAMSYQCILVLTLSLLAASVSLANPAATDKAAASSSALPKAQDPLFNKMLAEKPSIPMAQDPRFNKMYPEVDSKENDIEDEAKDALLPKKPAADLNPKYAQHAAILKKLDKVEQQKQPKAESTTVGTHRINRCL